MSIKEDKALARGRVCAASHCDRGGIIHVGDLWVCNKHYQRHINHGSFDAPSRPPPSRITRCSTCKREFDRGYAMNARRAAKHQFCSNECRAAHAEKLSLAGAEKRFWAMVDVRGPHDCWEWKGHRSPSGYGRFTWRRDRTQMANRIAFHFAKGDPGSLFVCHSCDNPACCNPSHLWLGSHRDNIADMVQKGRSGKSGVKGERHPHAKLNERAVREIRTSKLPPKELAMRFGVTPTAIYYVQRKKNWAWVR